MLHTISLSLCCYHTIIIYYSSKHNIFTHVMLQYSHGLLSATSLRRLNSFVAIAGVMRKENKMPRGRKVIVVVVMLISFSDMYVSAGSAVKDDDCEEEDSKDDPPTNVFDDYLDTLSEEYEDTMKKYESDSFMG